MLYILVRPLRAIVEFDGREATTGLFTGLELLFELRTNDFMINLNVFVFLFIIKPQTGTVRVQKGLACRPFTSYVFGARWVEYHQGLTCLQPIDCLRMSGGLLHPPCLSANYNVLTDTKSFIPRRCHKRYNT